MVLLITVCLILTYNVVNNLDINGALNLTEFLNENMQECNFNVFIVLKFYDQRKKKEPVKGVSF